MTASLLTCGMPHLYLQELLVHMLLYVIACETHLHMCYIKCCQAPVNEFDDTPLTDHQQHICHHHCCRYHSRYLDHFGCCNDVVVIFCGMAHAGLAVRMPATFLVMFGGGFTWKERLFFSFAWTPKVSLNSFLPCRCPPFRAVCLIEHRRWYHTARVGQSSQIPGCTG